MAVEKEDFLNLFKEELSALQDKELASKVAECWARAADLGGWNSMDEIFGIPFTLLAPAKGTNLITHTRAVTQCSIAIGKALLRSQGFSIKMDYLIAGALLHDVGKLMEIEPDGQGGFRKSKHGKLIRHPVSGATLAESMGIPREIVHIIWTHSKEGEGRRKTIEALIVHHADFIVFESLEL